MEKPYNILAINPGHNGSAAFVSDGTLVYYCEEERLSRHKYDGNPFRAMLQVLHSQHVDELVIGGTNPDLPKLPWTNEDPYTALVRKFNPKVKISNFGGHHHLGHASAAFYGSGWDTAAAVVVDGAGSWYSEEVGSSGVSAAGFETESIYNCSYPNVFTPVYKRFSHGSTIYYNNGVFEFDNSVTITKAYEAVSEYLGFGFIEAGKTMGLSPYGSPDGRIPQFFVEGKGNKNLLIPHYPAGALIDENRYPGLRRGDGEYRWHSNPGLVSDTDKNMAWHIQRDTEEQMYVLIERAIRLTGHKRVVISGGYGLNCVANYKYVKMFPGIEFWIDPVAHDGGTAIGLARHAWYQWSGGTSGGRLNNLYLGSYPDYSVLNTLHEQAEGITLSNSNSGQVAELLAAGKIVALYSGRSEAGPRALGNRSLLFDSRRPDGKDVVNSVKQREWFRPFAGSVLEECAAEWFDMAGMKSSPHMMYAVDVLNSVRDTIPAVTHVDGTCRVQTVSADSNPAFYELITEFGKLTGVPVLLNTSLNLAGQPLVDSPVDAILTFLQSGIEYVWLPDVGKLISKV